MNDTLIIKKLTDLRLFQDTIAHHINNLQSSVDNIKSESLFLKLLPFIGVVVGAIITTVFTHLTQRRIEEYKSQLTLKYELGKVLIHSKVKAYQIVTSLKEIIIRRNNKMGNEEEQMKQLFDKIPELLIHLGSQVQLRNYFQEEISGLENSFNEIVKHIASLKASSATTYTFDLEKVVQNIDKIQSKLLEG